MLEVIDIVGHISVEHGGTLSLACQSAVECGIHLIGLLIAQIEDAGVAHSTPVTLAIGVVGRSLVLHSECQTAIGHLGNKHILVTASLESYTASVHAPDDIAQSVACHGVADGLVGY